MHWIIHVPVCIFLNIFEYYIQPYGHQSDQTLSRVRLRGIDAHSDSPPACWLASTYLCCLVICKKLRIWKGNSLGRFICDIDCNDVCIRECHVMSASRLRSSSAPLGQLLVPLLTIRLLLLPLYRRCMLYRLLLMRLLLLLYRRCMLYRLLTMRLLLPLYRLLTMLPFPDRIPSSKNIISYYKCEIFLGMKCLKFTGMLRKCMRILAPTQSIQNKYSAIVNSDASSPSTFILQLYY